jgi:hypothetical protein
MIFSLFLEFVDLGNSNNTNSEKADALDVEGEVILFFLCLNGPINYDAMFSSTIVLYAKSCLTSHGYFINFRCGCFLFPIKQYVGKVEKHLLLMINMIILLICKCNEPTISKGRPY